MGFAPFTPISCRGPTHYEQADGDSSCVPDPGGDRLIQMASSRLMRAFRGPASIAASSASLAAAHASRVPSDCDQNDAVPTRLPFRLALTPPCTLAPPAVCP